MKFLQITQDLITSATTYFFIIFVAITTAGLAWVFSFASSISFLPTFFVIFSIVLGFTLYKHYSTWIPEDGLLMERETEYNEWVAKQDKEKYIRLRLSREFHNTFNPVEYKKAKERFAQHYDECTEFVKLKALSEMSRDEYIYWELRLYDIEEIEKQDKESLIKLKDTIGEIYDRDVAKYNELVQQIKNGGK